MRFIGGRWLYKVGGQEWGSGGFATSGFQGQSPGGGLGDFASRR